MCSRRMLVQQSVGCKIYIPLSRLLAARRPRGTIATDRDKYPEFKQEDPPPPSISMLDPPLPALTLLYYGFVCMLLLRAHFGRVSVISHCKLHKAFKHLPCPLLKMRIFDIHA